MGVEKRVHEDKAIERDWVARAYHLHVVSALSIQRNKLVEFAEWVRDNPEHGLLAKQAKAVLRSVGANKGPDA